MFKYTCEWAIVPFSQILIIKSPIIASTCLEFDNLSQLKMKVLIKKNTSRSTWKRCIQIMSQNIKSEYKNKLKVHKFVEDSKRLPSIMKESSIKTIFIIRYTISTQISKRVIKECELWIKVKSSQMLVSFIQYTIWMWFINNYLFSNDFSFIQYTIWMWFINNCKFSIESIHKLNVIFQQFWVLEIHSKISLLKRQFCNVHFRNLTCWLQ
jgi:hypothetical protein